MWLSRLSVQKALEHVDICVVKVPYAIHGKNPLRGLPPVGQRCLDHRADRGPFGPFPAQPAARPRPVGRVVTAESMASQTVGSHRRGRTCCDGRPGSHRLKVAEGVGFEPTDSLLSSAFKALALGRYANPPEPASHESPPVQLRFSQHADQTRSQPHAEPTKPETRPSSYRPVSLRARWSTPAAPYG